MALVQLVQSENGIASEAVKKLANRQKGMRIPFFHSFSVRPGVEHKKQRPPLPGPLLHLPSLKLWRTGKEEREDARNRIRRDQPITFSGIISVLSASNLCYVEVNSERVQSAKSQLK